MSASVRIAELYRTHGAAVLRRARRLMPCEADAQELVQDVFTALVRDPAPLLASSSPMALLYKATTHRALNRLRDAGTRRRLLERSPAAVTPTGPHGPDAHTRLQRVLALLPDDQAAAVVYHHLDGMTHAEIATLLECSRRHVGDLLERSRQTLAEQDVR